MSNDFKELKNRARYPWWPIVKNLDTMRAAMVNWRRCIPKLHSGSQSDYYPESRDSAPDDARRERMVVTDALYVAFLLGGTLYLIYRSYREFADRNFAHEISVVTGTVMREQQRSETKLSGTISGGSQVHGNISTRVTRFQEIFLALPDGKEARLDFENFKIPCREQHRLSVVGVRRSDGPWCDCAFHNHTTSETLVQRDEIFDTLKYDAAARIGGRWGLFVAVVALITQWDAGELVEGAILTNVLASGILGILVGLVVIAIFWFPVRIRTRSRCAAAERDIREAIDAAERQVQAEG